MKKENRGVTLITLVVTIIVLLILAGISAGTLLGENGIINMAKKAAENTTSAQAEEEKAIQELANNINKYNLGSTVGEDNGNEIIITKEQYNEILNRLDNLENNNGIYIDTKNVIYEIANAVNLSVVSYTATENCIIAGYVRNYSADSGCIISIDDVEIHAVGGSSTTYGDCNSIYIPIKKGQTIKFRFTNSDKNGINIIKAYGILK